MQIHGGPCRTVPCGYRAGTLALYASDGFDLRLPLLRRCPCLLHGEEGGLYPAEVRVDPEALQDRVLKLEPGVIAKLLGYFQDLPQLQLLKGIEDPPAVRRADEPGIKHMALCDAVFIDVQYAQPSAEPGGFDAKHGEHGVEQSVI